MRQAKLEQSDKANAVPLTSNVLEIFELLRTGSISEEEANGLLQRMSTQEKHQFFNGLRDLRNAFFGGR